MSQSQTPRKPKYGDPQEAMSEPVAKLYALERLIDTAWYAESEMLASVVTERDQEDLGDFWYGLSLLLTDIREELSLVRNWDFEKNADRRDDTPASAEPGA